MQKYGYISLKSLITQGSIFDPNILYERFPKEIVPFDFKTYRENPATYEIVTTNCLTGRAEYLSEKQNADRLTAIVKASSSLPYVAQITPVDGIPMLDGGIVDSIPVVRADFKVPRLFYKQYPRLRVVLSHHVKAYNEQLDLIERMEDWGEVICIRPERPMEVDRICRDVSKLEALYEEGFTLGEQFCIKVKK